ncbi:MAG: NnrS family protein [Roseiarcus sp.]
MTSKETTNPLRSAAARRSWKGAAIWSRGFRPFFLAAGVWAVIGIALWPPFLSGAIEIPTAFSAVDWHAHEMIFGYGAAVVSGFLLTAIPNWTGRLPVAGWPLAALTALWAAGRLAIFASSLIGRSAAAAVDGAYLIVFAALIAREVIAGRNWRNLKVAALVLALALVNLAFHFEDARYALAAYSQRAALTLMVMLILLIGGRVTPSFTSNWLARAGSAKRPVPLSRPDGAIMALSGASLALWIVAPDWRWSGALAVAAGLGNLWRLSRWRGLSARKDALVLVLHVGFMLAALGFVAIGAHALWPTAVPSAAGVHVWSVGAVGVMTLAMMTRATLGHAGRALVASKATRLAYLSVIFAMLARVGMALLPAFAVPLMDFAAGAWVLAFAAFLAAYALTLLRPAGATAS